MQYINYYKDMRAYFFLSDIQIVVYKAVLQYPSLNPCNTQTLVFFQGHCHSFFLSTVASLALPKTSQCFPGRTLGNLRLLQPTSRLKISKSGHFIPAGRCPDGPLQDQTVRIDFHFFRLKQSRVIGKHGFQSIFAFQIPKAQIQGSQSITFEQVLIKQELKKQAKIRDILHVGTIWVEFPEGLAYNKGNK